MMSSFESERRGNEASPFFNLVWSGLSLSLVILIAEIATLTVRFDTAALSSGEWIGSLLPNQLPLIPQIFAVIATTTLIFGSGQAFAVFEQALAKSHNQSVALVWLITNILSFVGLYFVTEYFFEIDHGRSISVLLIWLLLVSATFGTWFASIVAPSQWFGISRLLGRSSILVIVFGIAAWWIGSLATKSWSSLAFGTFYLVQALMASAGFELATDLGEFGIGTEKFAVRIAPECSGSEGMGLATVFVATFLWWRRNEFNFPVSLTLIPISIALMFFINVIRITALLIIGQMGFASFALGAFHSQAGWIGFNLAALAIVVYAKRSPLFSRSTQQDKGSESIAVPMLAPFVVLTLTIMVFANGEDFDWLYCTRFFAVAATILLLVKRYPAHVWSCSFNWLAPTVGLIVYFMWLLLESDSEPSINQLYANTNHEYPGMFAMWVVFRLLGSIVTVPLAEEFAFRGYLIPWLANRDIDTCRNNIPWAAIIVSSIAFGALHPGRWIAGTIAGVMFGFIYFHRGKIMDAVIAHSVANLLIAVTVLAGSRWSLWG